MIDNVWAIAVLNYRCRLYYQPAVTHARFAKRNMILFLFGALMVVCVEIYGFVKIDELKHSKVECGKQLIDMCSSKSCKLAVCS